MQTIFHKKKPTIGLVGIGLVGTALSKNLIQSGYDVCGFDIDSSRLTNFERIGGISASNPKDVGNRTDIVMLSLMTSDIVKEVIWEGENPILDSDSVPTYIIDTTTGDMEKTIQIAEKCAENGIQYLDATISGSSSAIENRKGVFMVGGNREAYEETVPVFNAICNDHIYVGLSGMGSKSKLAVNLVMGLNRVALAEGLIFAEKIGLDPNITKKIFLETFAHSKIMDLKIDRMIQEDFLPGGMLKQHLKDVKLMLTYASKLDQELPISKVHEKILEMGIEAGDGELDNSSLIKEFRRNRLQVNVKQKN